MKGYLPCALAGYVPGVCALAGYLPRALAEYVNGYLPRASAGYVKAHLARDVDNDLAQYQAYMQMYQKERAQIFINRKEYQTSSIEQIANSTGIGGGGFVIG